MLERRVEIKRAEGKRKRQFGSEFQEGRSALFTSLDHLCVVCFVGEMLFWLRLKLLLVSFSADTGLTPLPFVNELRYSSINISY